MAHNKMSWQDIANSYRGGVKSSRAVTVKTYIHHSELHFIMEKIRVDEPDATIHIIDCFTLWLTRERRKGEKSKFKKYFDTLPEEFSVPLTMTEEEFQLLPRQLKRRAERERIRLGKRFDYLECITKFHYEGWVLRISNIIYMIKCI